MDLASLPFSRRSIELAVSSLLFVLIGLSVVPQRWFVFHLSVLDPMSSCHCLSACLREIREWSDKHPTHHILFIEVEIKITGDFFKVGPRELCFLCHVYV